MHSITHYSILALALAAIFGSSGILHLAGPRFLRAAYERWEYPQRLRLTVGFLEIIAALLLADPASRGWGIGLTAMITFGAVITLLHNRQYLHALPTMAMLIALIPATLAVPRAPAIRFIAAVENTAMAQATQHYVVQNGASEPSAGE